MKLTKEQAVRIAYECARDFRDIAGGCGGVGVPWEDLSAAEKKTATLLFDAGLDAKSKMDEHFRDYVAEFLRSMIPE